MVLYFLNLAIPLIGPYSHTQRMWLLVSVGVGAFSLVVLLKEKFPSKRTIIIGLCLAILAGLIRPFTGLITFLAFLVSMRIFEGTESKVVVLKRPIFPSILLGVGVGIVLGLINLLLAGNQTPDFAPSFLAFIASLNPGISEEITYRLFFYALAVYLLEGKIRTRKEKIWVYVVMIVPHVLLHFPDTFFVDGRLHLDLGTLLVGPGILSLLFGLPMAVLMEKRDLTSAMITHTLVDFIRFVVYGLPF